MCDSATATRYATMADPASNGQAADAGFDDLERAERQPLNDSNVPQPTRSLYALTRKEIMKGIANRFVNSRVYIFIYLTMAALSVTTVVLSLGKGCPPLAFYVLEVIINSAMIIEVGIRFVAFGRQFWKSPFNTIDLILTLFCAITLLAITIIGCGGEGSKAEELFDTLLLVARNVLQFGRLAAVTRQSGQSIFSRPKPIDLSRAGRSRRLDIDLDDDDWSDEPGYRPLPQGASFTDDEPETPYTSGSVVFDDSSPRPAQTQNPWQSQNENRNRDAWDALG